MADAEPNCGHADNENTWFGLRVGSIFIILVTSLFATMFPVVAKRAWKIPAAGFAFAKYFGSGVIIATAFIHLLAPAFDELGADCVHGTWKEYDFAAAFAMASVFAIFFVELFAFRWGSKIIARSGINYDVHAGPTSHTHQGAGPTEHSRPHTEDGALSEEAKVDPFDSASDVEDLAAPVEDASAILAQLVGVAILEFGVIFHSIIIGLTLAVDEDFKTLFVVIIFHQMFEGLGLGSRLAYLVLPTKYRWVPYVGAAAYAIMTPLGIAIGLGVRTTYNPDSATANIVSGTLDAISAGILLYTGLVELLAHEFLFNPKMHTAPTGKIIYAGFCMLLGAGIMALLGRWA